MFCDFKTGKVDVAGYIRAWTAGGDGSGDAQDTAGAEANDPDDSEWDVDENKPPEQKKANRSESTLGWQGPHKFQAGCGFGFVGKSVGIKK